MKPIKAILITAIVLSGCGTAGATETPDNGTSENTSTASAETAPVLIERDYNGFKNEAMAKEYLEGAWTMLPQGAKDLSSQNDAKLSFHTGENKLVFWYESEEESLNYEMTYASLFEEQQVIDLLNLHPVEKRGENPKLSEDSLAYDLQFQFLAANVNGTDLLAVREMGNGSSYFASMQMDETLQAWDGFWVFERMEDTGSQAQKTDGTKKDETFYAFLWTYDDTVSLQEVISKEFVNDEFDQNVDSVRYWYEENEGLLAHSYEIKEDARWKLEDDVTGTKGICYTPALVKVTVDENSVITDLIYQQYQYLGMYKQKESQEFDYAGLLPEGEDTLLYAFAPGTIKTREEDLRIAKLSSEDYAQDVLFVVRETVTDFEILNLTLKETDAKGNPVFEEEVIYQQKWMSRFQPLLATLAFSGSIPNHAVRYTDSTGATKTFLLEESGKDGSFILSEQE